MYKVSYLYISWYNRMENKIKSVATADPRISVEAQIENVEEFTTATGVWRMKLHYLLFTGTTGSTFPFISIVARNQIKLAATSFGTVLIFSRFLVVLMNILTCYIADYYNNLKTIFFIISITQICCAITILFIPPIPSEEFPANESPIYLNTREQNNAVLNISILNSTSQKGFLEYLNDTISENDSILVSLDNETVFQNVQKFYEKENSYYNNEHFFNQSDSVNSTIIRKLSDKYIYLYVVKKFSINKTFSEEKDTSLISNILKKYNESINNNVFQKTELKIELSKKRHAKEDFKTFSFWIFGILFSIFVVCVNILFVISDTVCCEYMKKNNGEIGKQRLWGAIGWGSFTALSGFLNDYTKGYLVSFAGVGLTTLILMLWNVYKMDMAKPRFSKEILKNISIIIKRRKFIFFSFGVLVNGMGIGIIWSHLLWYITSVGGSQLICGLVESMQSVVGELPFLLASGWIISKLGYFHVSALSLLALGVRFIWFSQLQNPWLFLAVEWLHGISYGVFYNSMASFAKTSSALGTEALTQAVIFTTWAGLGAGIGNILAGVGIDYIGGHETFFYLGIYLIICACLYDTATFMYKF